MMVTISGTLTLAGRTIHGLISCTAGLVLASTLPKDVCTVLVQGGFVPRYVGSRCRSSVSIVVLLSILARILL